MNQRNICGNNAGKGSYTLFMPVSLYMLIHFQTQFNFHYSSIQGSNRLICAQYKRQ